MSCGAERCSCKFWNGFGEQLCQRIGLKFDLPNSLGITVSEVSRLEGELERATIASRSYAALAEVSCSA
eukprot:1718507-Amphidinium_carterae.1